MANLNQIVLYMGVFADVVDALVEEYERERLGYPSGTTEPKLRDFAAWVKERVDGEGDSDE